MIKGRTCLFLLTIIINLSCANFTEIPIPDYEPQLVINCLFNPDSTWKVNVSQNSALNRSDFLPDYITNAEIHLWENDQHLGTLEYTVNGNYELNQFPKVGFKYKLTVSAPGFPEVSAMDSIPIVPQEFQVTWDLNDPTPIINDLGLTVTRYPVSLTFKDIPDQNNYYKIQSVMRDSCNCINATPPFVDRYGDRLYLLEVFTKDPIVSSVSKKHKLILFDDNSFKNQMKNIVFYQQDTLSLSYGYRQIKQNDSIRFPFTYQPINANTPRKDKVDVYVDFWSISQSLYEFYLTYLIQAYNTADPFSTHINVRSNIVGGKGIFGGYQQKLILVYSH